MSDALQFGSIELTEHVLKIKQSFASNICLTDTSDSTWGGLVNTLTFGLLFSKSGFIHQSHPILEWRQKLEKIYPDEEFSEAIIAIMIELKEVHQLKYSWTEDFYRRCKFSMQ